MHYSTWYPALVGLVPGVGPDVLLEVGELGELPLADLAAVGLDPQVDPGVLGQVGTVGEGLVAAGALVGLRLPHVDLGVELQVCLGAKNLHKTTRESGPVDRPIDHEREREREMTN